MKRPAQPGHCLQNESGFANARVAANEYQRALDQATTENAVEFTNVDSQTLVFIASNFGEGQR